LRVRCGGMLSHIVTAVLCRRKPLDDRRTSAGVSNALGCDAELRSFVPESWIPNRGRVPVPERSWRRGESIMQQSGERPPQTPPPAETEAPDEKVIRLIPPPAAQHPADLPDEDDDDDPGPAAA
jgi:hypothetical protein